MKNAGHKDGPSGMNGTLNQLPEETAHRFTKPFAQLLRIEMAAGAVLPIFAVAAVAVSNSAWSGPFLAFWEMPVGLYLGAVVFSGSLRRRILEPAGRTQLAQRHRFHHGSFHRRVGFRSQPPELRQTGHPGIIRFRGDFRADNDDMADVAEERRKWGGATAPTGP